MLYLKRLKEKIIAMIKKNEDHCGCKTVYTPQGLQGPEGPPGVVPSTVIIPGHDIVIGDISPNGLSDITINSVSVSSEFIYKLMGNGMVWFSLRLGLNTTVGAGTYQGALDIRIDNLPITWGDPTTPGGQTMFQGDVFRGSGAAIGHLIVAEGLTVDGTDSIDILNFTEDIPVGTWNGMTIRMSGVAPGVIL